MGLLLIVALYSLSVFNADGKTLISTQAQVRDHVITNREVAIHKIVDKALGLRPDLHDDNSPLQALIREWLLYFEAQNFYNNPVPDKKIEESLKKVEQALKQSEEKKKWAITTSELEKKIRRREEANRLYLFKRKASVLPVSLTELETEYVRNRTLYGGKTFKEVRDEIRKQRDQESLEQRLQQWFEILENKYNVQRFFKYQAKDELSDD